MEIKIVSVGSEKQLAVIKAELSESIGDVKRKLHDVHTKLYPSRVSLRLKSGKSPNLSDDAILSSLDIQSNTLYCKDLGPQVGWTTVFLTEYSGPLFIYLLFYSRPALIYGADAALMESSPKVKVAMMCFTGHYIKRLMETVFVHRFSKATMPILNIFKNSIYYWCFAAWIAYFINHPLYTPVSDRTFNLALACFVIDELGNFSIHWALRSLRPPGSRARKIPYPGINPFTWLFSLVSCPNYTYELGIWLNFACMTSTIPAYLFMLAGFYQMTVWALGKHRNYKKEFKDYPRGRKAILPFLL